jgi:hypothetical protein
MEWKRIEWNEIEWNEIKYNITEYNGIQWNGPYMQVSVQFPGISVTILDVLYVVYIIITSVHQPKFWLNRINSSWVSVLENKSADVSITFKRLQKLCYIQIRTFLTVLLTVKLTDLLTVKFV